MDLLDEHVLVLNRSWVAVHIATARRALTLLYLGLARAVHPTEYSLHEFDEWLAISNDGLKGRYIHTPTLKIRLPEVILLKEFNGVVRREARFSRHSIFERDQNTCQYCGRVLPRSQLTLDHVIPQSRGGLDTWENLVVACMRCNVRKGNLTPEEAGMTLLHKPSQPSWLPKLGSRMPEEHVEIWQKFVDSKMLHFMSRAARHTSQTSESQSHTGHG